MLADRGENEALRGLLAARVMQDLLRYDVGPTTLFKRSVRQYAIFRGPVTATASPADIAAGMMCLSANMPADAVAFVSAVPCDSAVHELLTSPASPLKRTFHILPWGQPNLHCKIDWTGTSEAYLASLGFDSRRNLKRYAKKLFGDGSINARVERFRHPQDVDRFILDGSSVSDKTYQKRRLGLGLSPGGSTERRIRFAAERKGFLGHILYLGDRPAAFHYGFIFRRTFFVLQMGYDPAFSAHQPGSVLFFEVLRDVEKLKLDVTTIDCLPGVTDFKLRTTNQKVRIRNFYLFKRSFSGSLLYAWLRALDALATAAKRIVRRVSGRPGRVAA